MKRTARLLTCLTLAFTSELCVAEELKERIAQADQVQPPAGRLAIVADGTSPDPDDIGATAVIFGLLKATGVSHRLVHLSQSCDLKPTSRISPTDELRRQKVMEQVCRDGMRLFGPFPNLARCFNCRTEH